MSASAGISYQIVRAFDSNALTMAAQFGVKITRCDSSFVSYDGEGTLNIAPDEQLDADDTLLQIVLHELAHFWVEGPESRWSMDWGLSNLSDDHLDREYAALRLQYDATEEFGLEDVLHPTTIHRWFYECLRDADDSAYVPTQTEIIKRLENTEVVASAEEVFAATERSTELHREGLSRYVSDPRSANLKRLLRQVAPRIHEDRD